MALRSLVRKMPALGLRLSPTGPLMGPVRAPSPAAGSRLMSHGAPTMVDRLRPEIYSEEKMARVREEINRLRAETDQKRIELEKLDAEGWKMIEMTQQVMDAAEASYNEAARHNTEAIKSIMEDFRKIDKACDVVLVSCPLLIILMAIAM
ncbi:hypothetical protein ACQJBY_013861 [Aegilops geniculata]